MGVQVFAEVAEVEQLMKAIISMLGFFAFAAFFGIALVSAKWNERYEYEPFEDDRS